MISIDLVDGSKTVLKSGTDLRRPNNATYDPESKLFHILDQKIDGNHHVTMNKCFETEDLGLSTSSTGSTIALAEGISYNPIDGEIYVVGSGAGSANFQSNYLYKLDP